MKKYEEGEEWLEKAMADPFMKLELMEPTVAFFCLAGARLYAKMSEYEKCISYFRRYMDYKDKLENERQLIEDGSVGIVSDVFQEALSYGTILLCMESVIRMGDEALAKRAFYTIDWSDERLLGQAKYEKEMLNACCRVSYRPLWAELMQTLFARKNGAKEMYSVFLLQEMEYKKNGETEELSRLRRLVSELEYDHHYIIYTKILWEMQKLEKAVGESSLEETVQTKETRKRIKVLFAAIFERYVDRLLDIREEVWEVAEKLDIPLEPLFLKTDYRKWRDALDIWEKEASAESAQNWKKRIARWKQTEDIRYDLFEMKRAGVVLHCFAEEKRELAEWEEALFTYADHVITFYKLLYKESVFREMPEVLPDEAWIALCLEELRGRRRADDDKGALAALRKCIGISPALEKALETYAEGLKDMVQNRNREAEKAKDELEVLLTSLKTMARLKVRNGEYQAAREILSQIQNCFPEDGEVRDLIKLTEEV